MITHVKIVENKHPHVHLFFKHLEKQRDRPTAYLIRMGMEGVQKGGF